MDHKDAYTRSIGSCDLVDLSFDLLDLLDYLLLGVVSQDLNIFFKAQLRGDEGFLCFLRHDLGTFTILESPNRESLQFRVEKDVDSKFSGTAPDQPELSEG